MKKKVLFFLAVISVSLIIGLYRLDYYIVKPGGAYEVSEFIEVKNKKTHDGTLHLMTVSMQVATPISYAIAAIDKNADIVYITKVRRPDETDADYNKRQQKNMTDSQLNAKYIALSQLGLPAELVFEGLYVWDVLENSAADGKIEAGDEITHIEGKVITSKEMLSEQLAHKKEGDVIQLTLKREGEKQDEKIALQPIPKDKNKRVGLGITYNPLQSLKTTPKVSVDAGAIGGPSAGLMFTLGIMNALSEQDITKGYAVAGSGTMNQDGTVGAIGEIGKKVIAAHKDNIEIFFALNEPLTAAFKEAYPKAKTNYEEAVASAKRINTSMKIVPVRSIDDALTYLEELPPKVE